LSLHQMTSVTISLAHFRLCFWLAVGNFPGKQASAGPPAKA
jgi:hypothetical protein